MSKKQITTWLAAALGSFGAFAAPAKVDYATMPANDPRFFPLVAWDCGTNFPDGMSSVEGFQSMADCGLTVAGFYPIKELAAVEKAGLKTFISDSRANHYDFRNFSAADQARAEKLLTELVEETGENPAVYGYFLTDEPQAGALKGLGQLATLIHKLAPQKIAYINLLPNYAPPSMLEAKDYPDYLEKFFLCGDVSMGCYDFYGLMEDRTLRGGFWENLHDMRSAALKHGKPFWYIALTTGHYHMRVVEQADVSFQVFAAITYGAKGICYFTYLTPRFTNYRQGPIDQFGEKTPAWEALRYVNRCVLNLAPTLNMLTSKEVYHLPAVQPLPESSSITQIEGPEDAAFAIGEFTHAQNDFTYVMILNKSLEKSFSINNVTFRNPVKSVQKVSKWEAGKLEDFVPNCEFLGPGEAVLLKLEFAQ